MPASPFGPGCARRATKASVRTIRRQMFPQGQTTVASGRVSALWEPNWNQSPPRFAGQLSTRIGDLIDGFKSDASMWSSVAGNGVVLLSDDRNMDATSTRRPASAGYRAWSEEQATPVRSRGQSMVYGPYPPIMGTTERRSHTDRRSIFKPCHAGKVTYPGLCTDPDPGDAGVGTH